MIGKPETEDLQEAKKIAEEAVNRVKEVLPKEEEVKIGFGWTEKKFHKEKKDGVSGMAFSPDYFEIDFNSNVEDWKENFTSPVVHEFAHTYFYEKKDMSIQDDMPIWMYILSEALTQNTAEKVVPNTSKPWRDKYSKKEIEEYWEKIKEEELDRNYSYPEPLFIDREEEKYPNWIGYSLAYRIGRKLIEDGVELKDFPNLDKEDVIEAGDELFGEKS